jgi:transcriptional regulator with XRE-family HTH domain
MDEAAPHAIGQRIKAARQKLKLSQAELARAADLAQTSLSQWETGRSSPKYFMVKRLAKILEVDPAWLLFGEEEKKILKVDARTRERADILTPALSRAARGLLHISQRELANRAEIATKTLADFESEKGRAMHIPTLRALRQALEEMGIEFSRDEEGGHRIGLKSGKRNR